MWGGWGMFVSVIRDSWGNLLIVLFLQFRCNHDVKIELDIILAIFNRPGRAYRSG
jgi:hypothetical protein